jgi:hypothetical protein
VVTDALAAGVLPGEQLEGCVNFLASNFDQLPTYVQVRLRKVASALTAHVDDFFDGESFDSAVFSLRVAAGVLDDAETMAGLLEARHAAGSDFARIVGNLPISDRDAFMLDCTVDPDPEVRA